MKYLFSLINALDLTKWLTTTHQIYRGPLCKGSGVSGCQVWFHSELMLMFGLAWFPNRTTTRGSLKGSACPGSRALGTPCFLGRWSSISKMVFYFRGLLRASVKPNSGNLWTYAMDSLQCYDWTRGTDVQTTCWIKPGFFPLPLFDRQAGRWDDKLHQFVFMYGCLAWHPQDIYIYIYIKI